MIEKKDLIDGSIVWVSELEFNNKTGKFGCLRNTHPTKGTVKKESAGIRIVSFKNSDKTLTYISDSIYSRYEQARRLNSLYKTEEEAIDEYNRQIYLQFDKLESFYEEQKRKLEKRIIKKKED